MQSTTVLQRAQAVSSRRPATPAALAPKPVALHHLQHLQADRRGQRVGDMVV